MLSDFRYAARGLRKNPEFSLLAVLTLALGIGANTAIFALIRAVFLAPLPYPHEERLVAVWSYSQEHARERTSPANFVDWAAQNAVFEELGAWPSSAGIPGDFNVILNGAATRVRGSYVSSGFFRTLGAQPILGRTFLPEEDRALDHRALVLGHGYWQRQFEGDPAILGKIIEIDTFRGGLYTIVGVMPPRFDYPRPVDLYLPMAFWGAGPLPATDSPGRCCSWFSVIGRLKPGVPIERAQSEMTAIARRLSARYPDGPRTTMVRVERFRDDIVGDYRTGLLVLFGAVGCVLLIACANVANLVLSRVLSRRSEISIRRALGATTPRLVRQVLIESLLLSGIGAAAGVLLAIGTVNGLAVRAGAEVALARGARIDWGVLGFALVLTVATGCCCGVAACTSLSGGGSYSHTEGLRGRRLRQALVAGEIAVAVLLVAGAVLLIRSLHRLESVDLGFRPEQVLAMSFDFTAGPFRGPGNQQPYFHDLLQRVAALPGVRAAGAISEPPLSRRRLPDQPISVEGQPLRTAAETPHVILLAATPAYFPAMAIALKKGRLFTESDSSDGRLVAIVNEAAAKLLWHGEDPIGKRIAMGSRERFGYFRAPPRPGEAEWREVVGVVSDVRSSSPDVAPQPQVFHSYRQHPFYETTLVLRTVGGAAALAAAIRHETTAISPRIVVTKVTTMERIVADSVAQPRFRARLIGLFSALAVLLGMLGIYGVASYTVVQRTQEIGIRVALGAARRDVVRLVMAGAARATAAGLALGLIGYFTAVRWISSLLYGVQATDPVTIAVTCTVFTAAMFVATYLPARRAASVDPASALRE